MPTELKDVLHLYIGATIMCANESCNEDLEYYGMKRKVSHLLFDKYLNGNWKPILRPLTDITTEEADHFAWLCLDSETHLDEETRVTKEEIQTDLHVNDGGLLLDDDIEIYIEVSCRCFEGAVLIKKDGSINVVDEEQVQCPIVKKKVQKHLKA